MRLERVALRGFLSHPDTDWSPNGARLVSIVGANGAGKSSLAVDGPLFALYDDARGRTDDLVSLGATDMSARVEFEFAGDTYAVERGRTRKAGGKSYLELQVRDGDAWRPLTGDTIADTQKRIAQLLRMDAKAFETSVILGQGHAMAFAEATAAERKRILGQVLDLEVYARAETRARELARDLDARTAVERDRIVRLVDAIAEFSGAERVRAEAAGILEAAGAEIATAGERRTTIDARLLELASELAAGAAAETDVTRLDGERSSLADRYRREQKAITDADAVLAGAADVTTAASALPLKRAALEVMVEAEGKDRALGLEIAERRKAFDPLERQLAESRATWTAELRGVQARVTELVAGVNALEPVICRQCGTANVVDQAGLTEQLADTRFRAKTLTASEPTEPMPLSRERVAIKRLEERRAEDVFDRIAFVQLQAEVVALERVAARGEAIAIATAAKADAALAIAEIGAAGVLVAEQLAAAKAKAAGLDQLHHQRAALQAEMRTLLGALAALDGRRSLAQKVLAGAEAQLERRAQLQTEHDELVATTAAAAAELGILRQLVTAFGVTGIPARIIESVIPELEGYANELLAELRPGMELSIRAQRAKKDGKGLVEALDLIVQDPAGERPLAMFSGGERMSVSLAIAVALSRLVARRAGAAIRSLVVDEPDGLDSDARRAFGQALRVLAHHGELERVVLVSHHEDLAEYGDATYRVTKNGQGSVVEQVA